MTSLLSQAFQNAKNENRPALLTYTVAGDNTKKKSLEILKSISNYADICELGFPHNTPIADGGLHLQWECCEGILVRRCLHN